MNKALFLDRDGIFNEILFRDGIMSSPRNWSEIRLYPNLERLKEVKVLGYQLVMITNQPDIERGVVRPEFVSELHAYYQKQYDLDKIYVCPFADNQHPMKKPNPGMFLQAAQELSLSLKNSFHLGDTERDTGAAKNCGCKSILWNRPYNKDVESDFRIESVEEIIDILRHSLCATMT